MTKLQKIAADMLSTLFMVNLLVPHITPIEYFTQKNNRISDFITQIFEPPLTLSTECVLTDCEIVKASRSKNLLKEISHLSGLN